MVSCTQLLRRLVALRSVNPAFLPSAAPGGGESGVAEYLAGLASANGLEVEWQKVLPGRPGLLVRLSPAGKLRHRLLLAPHLDTVNGSAEQFVPRVRNGRLYGRGACDTKGSVSAMMAALCRLAKSGNRPRNTEIVFAGLIDEEHGQTGSRALAASGLEADLAIVGEPTRLKVVTAHKGSVWLRVQTSGKAAHGARPQLGVNAVLKAAKAVVLLETAYARALRRRRHPLLGQPTVSIGVMTGGTQPNIVPDSCSFELDRRTLPGETDATVQAEVTSFLRRAGIQAHCVPSKLQPCLPLETNPGLPEVRDFLKAAGQRRPAGVDYFCDASVLARAGIPSVVFGPGDISQAHTADEWVELEQVEQATAILGRYLSSLP